MHLHPAIAALRDDDAPQRQAQAALFAAAGAWRDRPEVAAILVALESFGGGTALAELPRLAALFAPRDAAALQFASGFVGELGRALSSQPLGHLPWRHFTDGTVSTLQLGRSGRATLTLTALDGAGLARRPTPVSVAFAAGECRELVIAGGATAELISGEPCGSNAVKLRREPLALEPGTVVTRNAARQALLVDAAPGCLVSLRLHRRPVVPEPTREYRLSDGALVHQAAGDPRQSRHELMLALLGRMGRSEAAPLLAEIAGDEASPGAVRWHALRECLGLDTGAGFAALTSVARTASDPLAAAAGALRVQLVETYPQLASVAECPA
ncbi:MAG: hypothetical protein JF593_03795 [Novosphingobium sp.]|nr:hypothetical protein [Novosphingobium sp.]